MILNNNKKIKNFILYLKEYNKCQIQQENLFQKLFQSWLKHTCKVTDIIFNASVKFLKHEKKEKNVETKNTFILC